jgi:hypothetical protein
MLLSNAWAPLTSPRQIKPAKPVASYLRCSSARMMRITYLFFGPKSIGLMKPLADPQSVNTTVIGSNGALFPSVVA